MWCLDYIGFPKYLQGIFTRKEVFFTERKSNSLYEKYSEVRDRKGLTDFNVAKNSGIPLTTIYDWRNGLYTPKIDKLMKICKYLEIPIGDFLKE